MVILKICYNVPRLLLRGTVLQKKGSKRCPFLKKRVLFWYPFFRGVLFRSKKKVEIKQYPSEEGYQFSTPRGTFFLNNHVYETVPLRSLGHQNTILWTVK